MSQTPFHSYGRPVAIAALAFAVAAACSSKSSPSGTSASSTSTSGAGGGSPGATFGQSCRGQCVATACASEITSCNADPGCAHYESCVDACAVGADGEPDPSCLAKCPAAGSTGAMAQQALDACRVGASCPSCGGDAGSNTDDAGDAGSEGGSTCSTSPILTQQCSASTSTNTCVKCGQEKCCNTTNALLQPGPTMDFAECVNACADGDFSCLQTCATMYPNGIQGYGEEEACIAAECISTGACSASACETCQDQKCPCELLACESDPQCFLPLKCIGDCTTQACAKACTNGVPAASQMLLDAVGTCGSANCIGHGC